MSPRRAAGSWHRAEAHTEAPPGPGTAALVIRAGCRSTCRAQHHHGDPHMGPTGRELHTAVAQGEGGSVALMGAFSGTSADPAAGTTKGPV